MRTLIIANSRYKGGLSGGDAIYESFKKYWPTSVTVWDMQEIDYKPFALCYLHRIVLGCFIAIFNSNRWDIVYSASDFLPDSLPALILKFRGNKWVAGLYLKAFKENRIHYWTQKVVRKLIDRFADMVIVTNPTMFDIFPNKKKTWINGGIDLKFAGLSGEQKVYDAVFCGRIHPSKGIDELIDIWQLVREKKPNAQLAIIGDGDLGLDYIKNRLKKRNGEIDYMGINLLGYMGDARFDVYKRSRVVLYPTPLKYDHFSMAPVEAMACGCPMVCFKTPVIEAISPSGAYVCDSKESFVKSILDEKLSQNSINAYQWSQKYDYEQQSLRVFNEIIKELFNEDSSNRV